MIKGLKALFATKGIDERYFFEQNDVFRYGLWFDGAEYAIFVERFNEELLEVSLRHYHRDIWPNRHVYFTFEKFLQIFHKIEFEVYLNREIEFSRKPFEILKRMEEEKKGENDHGS